MARTLVLIAYAALAAAPHMLMGQFVELKGRTFMLNGQDFYPLAMNYGIEFVANTNRSTNPSEIYVSPNSQLDASVGSHFECMDPGSCDQQLRDHFQKMLDMGYNTVRLVGAAPAAYRTTNGQRSYKLVVHPNIPYTANYRVDLDMGTFSGAMAERYFDLVLGILDAAEDIGLKIILLAGTEVRTWPIVGGEDAIPYLHEDALQYALFLEELAAKLKDHPALLAYDVINEPAWRRNAMIDMTKAEVCEFTSMWYDAITWYDHNHLVTLGGAGKHDIKAWDPAVMKIDFYSPHLYLEDDWPWADIYDMPATIDMYMAELYWLAASTPMPWMIGETSFSADSDNTDHLNNPNLTFLDGDPAHHIMPYMHGYEAEQAQFATMTMDATRAYMGSGYSWWYLQNGRSFSHQGVVSAQHSPANVRSNYLGALGYGDGTLPWRDKAMVAAVANYQLPSAPSALPAPPAAYDNWHSLTGPFYRTYHLRDQNDEPIEHGLVYAKWEYDSQTPGEDSEYLHTRIASSVDGSLQIRKPPTSRGNFDLVLPPDIEVSVAGASSVSGLWPNGTTLPAFERHVLDMDGIVTDVEVISEPTMEFSAWLNLTVQDVTVLASGFEDEVVFHARESVHAVGEFHAGGNSEVHLLCEKTFPDCNSSAYQLQPPGELTANDPKSDDGHEQRKSIELKFAERMPELLALPNPTAAWSRLSCAACCGPVRVYNSSGNLVLSAYMVNGVLDLDLSALSAGTYPCQLQSAGEVLQTTITLIR